jgi:hypothetical protein
MGTVVNLARLKLLYETYLCAGKYLHHKTLTIVGTWVDLPMLKHQYEMTPFFLPSSYIAFVIYFNLSESDMNIPGGVSLCSIQL